MGTFDSHHDAPKKLRQEGEELVINFERTGTTTGRITWNIPPPADGCNSDNQAYSGIVVVLNTVANNTSNWPVDGTVYTGDPTADADLHAGDNLGDALIVGAFYNDKTTTSINVTDLASNAAYFITGHILDNVNRYHKQGVSSYSLPFLYTDPQDDTCSYQEVGFPGNTISGSTATGLAGGSPDTLYTIDLTINGVRRDIAVLGSQTQTFDELITAINKSIKRVQNPFAGAAGPNAGSYWYNSTTRQLFQWDGSQHNEIGVIVEATDPTSVAVGTYWLDTDDDSLYRWNGATWILQSIISSGFDPVDPPDGSYWIQLDAGSPEIVDRVWEWEGTVWCDRTFFEQAKDPSCPPELTTSSYWYDETTETLNVWSPELNVWVQTEGIAWDEDPRSPSIGTFWFDDTNDFLYERTNATTWTQRTVLVSTSTPSSTAIPGTFWFNPTEQALYTKVVGSPIWAPTAAIVWGTDPTLTESCDLWWDLSSSPQVLRVWNEVNSAWTPVENFFISPTNPALAQELAVGVIWIQPGSDRLYWQWDGSQFVQISSSTVIENVDDPTDVVAGDIWYDSTNNIYNERVAGPAWSALDVVGSSQDPTTLTVGSFWFNTTSSTLNMWNGASWIAVMFSAVSLTPASGTLWYNTTLEELFEWDSASAAWVVSTPLAVATLNDSRGVCGGGNIVFATTLCGSDGGILVGDVLTTSNLTTFVTTEFRFTGTLFSSLSFVADLKQNVIGVDGLTGIPSYDTVGVGTDGSADERRELADSIRRQLGYPTIQVELDKVQLDTAIQKALEALRQRSASAYRRVYFFLDAKEGIQHYLMTNERVGFNKIINVMGIWRITSAFLSTVHAAGVYGQTILQHLYHMGTYDLVSYHLIADYIEQLEQLFATRVTYTFDEGSRELFMFQRFTRDERVLLDCVIERTEQELMVNRYTKMWIERWALGEAKLMLAQIRGKYSTLPGAGGGVALNAGDLSASAQDDFARCDQEIDDFVVNDVENIGIGSEVIIG